MGILINEVHGIETLLVAPFVLSLNTYYPGIKDWLVNCVVPGENGGVVLVARDANKVLGVAMARRGSNPKLRCIRVLPELRGSGLGVRLIDKALESIECTKPECTVAEELIHEYSRLFISRYGFELTEVERGMYRSRKLEYCFNSR